MKSYIWVIVGILVILGIFFAIKNFKLIHMNSSGVSQTSQTQPSNKTITSSDGRVSFQYPSNWNVVESTGGKGEFGTIIQKWILTSYQPAAEQGGIPANSGQVVVEIQNGGSNLSIDQLIDCNMKLTCEKVGIDNEQFLKATGTLNSGSEEEIVATFYDNKILKMSGLATAGSNQQQLLQTINTIMNSIKFSNQ
jgi:hypothetical protein